MLNPNQNNSACGFAEEIVSYLYGEIGGAEKQKFEAHLNKCDSCADEIAEVSDVRFAFAELKDEFSAMKTPVISIPYEIQSETVEVSSVQTSWFDGIRVFLTNISAWQTATAAFAVLVFLVIFSMFLLKKDNNENDLAANIVKDSPKPTVNKTEKNPIIKPENSPEVNSVKENNSVETQPDFVSPKNDEPKPKSVVKVAERPQSKAKNTNSNKQTTPKNENLKNNRNNRNDLPRLNDDQNIEDDSLRLADLFEEIDTTDE